MCLCIEAEGVVSNKVSRPRVELLNTFFICRQADACELQGTPSWKPKGLPRLMSQPIWDYAADIRNTTLDPL